MSAHPVGVFGVGTEPPPDSTDPSFNDVIRVGLASTLARSACVIWPTFSSNVIRPSRSCTRRSTGSRGFIYASAWVVPAVSAVAAVPDVAHAATAGRSIPRTASPATDLARPRVPPMVLRRGRSPGVRVFCGVVSTTVSNARDDVGRFRASGRRPSRVDLSLPRTSRK
jgi:hypothetical protein